MRPSFAFSGLLAAIVALAGCLAPAASEPPPGDAPAATLATTVEHHGCSLDVAFFGLPVEDVRSRLPPGFEPALVQDAFGREQARSFVVGYTCERSVVDGVAGGAVAEFALALGVEPPADLGGEATSHWIARYSSPDAAVARAYAAWGLGGAGDVTRSVTGAGETGQRTTAATTDTGSHTFTSRSTLNVVELPTDVLRFFAPGPGGTMAVVDLVVEPARGGTGPASYESDDDSFYPATRLDGQGFTEAWPDLSWTFTLADGAAPTPT